MKASPRQAVVFVLLAALALPSGDYTTSVTLTIEY